MQNQNLKLKKMWTPKEKYKNQITVQLTKEQFELLERDIPEWLEKFFIKAS